MNYMDYQDTASTVNYQDNSINTVNTVNAVIINAQSDLSPEKEQLRKELQEIHYTLGAERYSSRMEREALVQ